MSYRTTPCPVTVLLVYLPNILLNTVWLSLISGLMGMERLFQILRVNEKNRDPHGRALKIKPYLWTSKNQVRTRFKSVCHFLPICWWLPRGLCFLFFCFFWRGVTQWREGACLDSRDQPPRVLPTTLAGKAQWLLGTCPVWLFESNHSPLKDLELWHHRL